MPTRLSRAIQRFRLVRRFRSYKNRLLVITLMQVLLYTVELYVLKSRLEIEFNPELRLVSAKVAPLVVSRFNVTNV